MGKSLRYLPEGADFNNRTDFPSDFNAAGYCGGGKVMHKAQGGAVRPNAGYAGGGQVVKKAMGGPMGALQQPMAPAPSPMAMRPAMPTQPAGPPMGGGGQSPLLGAVVDAVLKQQGRGSGTAPTQLAKGGRVQHLAKGGKVKESSGDKAKTDVKSPTSTKTSTVADTRGNVTVTGGAGDGATNVNIGKQKAAKLAAGGKVKGHKAPAPKMPPSKTTASKAARMVAAASPKKSPFPKRAPTPAAAAPAMRGPSPLQMMAKGGRSK